MNLVRAAIGPRPTVPARHLPVAASVLGALLWHLLLAQWLSAPQARPEPLPGAATVRHVTLLPALAVQPPAPPSRDEVPATPATPARAARADSPVQRGVQAALADAAPLATGGAAPFVTGAAAPSATGAAAANLAKPSADDAGDLSADTGGDGPERRPSAMPAVAALAALPRYAVDVPAAFVTPLTGLRNGQPVQGEWRFEREASAASAHDLAGDPQEHHRQEHHRQEHRYRSAFTLQAGGRPWLQWDSAGPLRSHGLQPERFEDTRRGRRDAAQLDHDQATAAFSGKAQPVPISLLAQDRLSWMLQLISAVRADARLQQAGAELHLQVLGARGASQIWLVQGQGPAPLALRDGRVLPAALQFVREPQWPYDNRVEVWLNPDQGHALVRLRITQWPSGTWLDLWAQAS